MSANAIRNAIRLGSRKPSAGKSIVWNYRDARGKRVSAIGRAVSVHATDRGISIKLDSGKTVVVRCSRQTVCELFGLC